MTNVTPMLGSRVPRAKTMSQSDTQVRDFTAMQNTCISSVAYAQLFDMMTDFTSRFLYTAELHFPSLLLC